MFDVIVLGVGGMGGAAAAALARRGHRVLGLEQFAVGHDRGSSHGSTRVIRTAYFEHPDYVPLVRRAFRRWHELEQRTGTHLLTRCDCLSVGRPDGELIAGVRRAADEHALAVEALTPADLRRRYPPFQFDESYVGLVEHEAGFLHVDACVRAFARDAEAHGATVKAEEPVTGWEAGPGGVTVHTNRATYAADRLVVTAGAWATRLLGAWGAKLRVMRQVSFWLVPRDPAAFCRDRFPVYLAETPEACFYGLPAIDPRGHKLARHYGAPELDGPEGVDRAVSAADESPVREFVRRHLPAADGERRDASVCLYTLSPDRHFVIDVHPEHANVVVAAGFSGHGFKFASAVGEVLADLAETGRTELPVELFGMERLMK
jgi:sarcosine oxidase